MPKIVPDLMRKLSMDTLDAANHRSGNPGHATLSRPSWLRLLGWTLVAGYLLTLALIHVEGLVDARRGDAPHFSDFTSLYAAAMLVREEPAVSLYDARAMYLATVEAAQAAYDERLNQHQAHLVGFHPWRYPPVFILIAAPLAFLPYFWAYGLWLAFTVVPYLAAVRVILRDSSAWLFALAAPPAFLNAMYGQTGFLTAGLIGLGLAWLKPRPVLAGICLGLACFKPHFGVLIPLALLLGGHWRAVGAASAIVLVLGLSSLAAFGWEPWRAFFGGLLPNVASIESPGTFEQKSLITVLGMMKTAGAAAAPAWTMQIAAAAAAMAAVVWTWRRSAPQRLGLQGAVLCSATLLALPFAHLYDSVLLVPAAAWIWSDMRERGWRRWEVALLVCCGLGLMTAKWLLAATQVVQAGALYVAALLFLALHRYRWAR